MFLLYIIYTYLCSFHNENSETFNQNSKSAERFFFAKLIVETDWANACTVSGKWKSQLIDCGYWFGICSAMVFAIQSEAMEIPILFEWD